MKTYQAVFLWWHQSCTIHTFQPKNFRRKTNIFFLWYCYVLDLSLGTAVVPLLPEWGQSQHRGYAQNNTSSQVTDPDLGVSCYSVEMLLLIL